MIKTLKNMLGLLIGISIFATGMGLTMAFGLLAFIGMPMLIIGLGLLSGEPSRIRRRSRRSRSKRSSPGGPSRAAVRSRRR